MQDNPYATNQGQYSARATAAPQGNGVAPAGELIKDTTTAGFSADVIAESRNQPVLVDFWAPWCGPCKQLTPMIEKAVRKAGGKVKLVKMNIDDHPSVAGQLGIQSIPAVIAFVNGKPVDGFMGAVPERQIKDFINKVGAAGDPKAQLKEALAAAAQAAEAGDAQTAADIYSAVLDQDEANVEALAGLAGLLFDAGQPEEAEALLERVPPDVKQTPALSGIRAKIALAKEVAALGNPAELERRLAADPKDHQARFDMAMIQNARGERAEAADNLLKIMKADRSWKEDGARAQLLKFFEAWGMTDEATLSARRKLSSLLFS